MKESIRRLPDGELEVMQALWQADHPLLRSELDQVPGQKNGWAPQVLVTMLTRLEKKGFVRRNKEGRSYRYEALISRDEYLASESESLVERLYGGQPAGFIAALQRSKGLSAADIQELEAILKKAKEELK